MTLPEKTIDEILSQYFPSEIHWIVHTGKSGYNNTTRYIQIGAEKYILRIYETHKDESKVKLEHEVLIELNKIASLPFQVPIPILSKAGQHFVHLNNGSGKIACLYQYINGDNPEFDNREIIHSFGKMTGLILKALKDVHPSFPYAYRPYYEIENAHPNCPIDKVKNWCVSPPKEFRQHVTQLKEIAKQLTHFKGFVPKLQALPHQLIHGDLNASNVLSRDNKVTAILDFEFASNDLRVMEIAVCLSELVTKNSPTIRVADKINAFLTGLLSIINLTPEEIEVLPLLIHLRRLDVFIHFLGRYLDGIDSDSILKEQIDKAYENYVWLKSSGEQLIKENLILL
jgi:homoserine kinase type II